MSGLSEGAMERYRESTLATILLLVSSIAFLQIASQPCFVRGAPAPYSARSGWAPGSMEELLQRFPKRETNGAALEIERLSAALGIDIATKGPDGRSRPSKEDEKRFDTVHGVIQKWLPGEMERQ